MSKDLRLDMMVEMVSNEKGIDPETIYDALRAAVASATKKQLGGGEMNIRVELDPQTNDYTSYRYWDVVTDADDPILETEDYPETLFLTLARARLRDPNVEVGGRIEEKIAGLTAARISAQTAKHVILQKIREAERTQMLKSFEANLGKIVNGTVKKVIRDFIYVDIGRNAEAVLPREEMIPREVLRVGDRVRALLFDIKPEMKGPQIFLSRTRPGMLMELFKVEVPEINEEVIEMKAAARDPGSRAKIAVKTNDGRIDPVGACVGMRGSRVQAVSGELCGERIDIILWDDNPAQLVINAMAPAEVTSIVMDEDNGTMDVLVSEEQLSQAIGRNGQNVRLVRDLTGWSVNVMTEAQAQQKSLTDSKDTVSLFMKQLDVDEEVALILVQEGFTRLEEIAYVPQEELLNIEGFDEEVIQELQGRARDALLQNAIVSDGPSSVQPAEDLLSLPGMTPALATALANRGVATREDLAEQSVDELSDLENLDPEQAAQFIMAARAHWFADEA